LETLSVIARRFAIVSPFFIFFARRNFFFFARKSVNFFLHIAEKHISGRPSECCNGELFGLHLFFKKTSEEEEEEDSTRYRSSLVCVHNPLAEGRIFP